MQFRLLPAATVLLTSPLAYRDADAQRSRSHSVEVRAVDFAFTVPDTLTSGSHLWSFVNNGTVRHELIVVRLPASVPVETAIDSLHARGLRAFLPGSPALGVASSALFAAAGQRSDAQLLTQDRRGDRLVVFCQLREAPEKPKHDEMGMFKVIYIK